MTELTFKAMKGIEPVLDTCLQESAVADIAHNVKLWHGRLDPWRAPQLCKSVLNACAAHLRDCCWRTSEDPCARFVDLLCGHTILSSPNSLPSVIKDFCDPESQICPLGFPCPEKPTVTQVSGSEPCYTSEIRSYMITYGDDCDYGAPSMLTEPVYCTNKDDAFSLELPQPDSLYCNITKIRIYRLVTTLSVENSHNHDSREHRAQGDALPQASDGECFEVGCVDVGTMTFVDDESSEICEAVVSEEWDEPPCGLVIHGMFDSGALVGSHGRTLRFSEYNTHHAWPCKYEITLDCDIVTVCVCDNYAIVFTTGGITVVQDNIEAIDNFCRVKRDVKRALPLCNHKAVVCANGQAIFASKDGLYRVDGSGQVENLSKKIGSDQWREMDPGTMRLGLYGGRIMMSSNRFSGVYDIDIFGDGSPVSETLSTIDACPTCWLNDKAGNLYMLGTEGIYQWDAGDERLDMRWRSAERNYPGFGYATAARIEHTKPGGRKQTNPETTQVSFYADGCKVFERGVNHNEPFRIPRCRAHSYAIEIQGRRSVSSATIAASIRCMGLAA